MCLRRIVCSGKSRTPAEEKPLETKQVQFVPGICSLYFSTLRNGFWIGDPNDKWKTANFSLYYHLPHRDVTFLKSDLYTGIIHSVSPQIVICFKIVYVNSLRLTSRRFRQITACSHLVISFSKFKDFNGIPITTEHFPNSAWTIPSFEFIAESHYWITSVFTNFMLWSIRYLKEVPVSPWNHVFCGPWFLVPSTVPLSSY